MVCNETRPSGIPDKIVMKVVARRGRLHAFQTIEPAKTALVIIDLDEATVGREDRDSAQRVASNVNAVAHALRGRGGVVAWVLSRNDVRSSLLRDTQPACAPSQRFKCGLSAALTWVGVRMVRYSFPV